MAVGRLGRERFGGRRASDRHLGSDWRIEEFAVLMHLGVPRVW